MSASGTITTSALATTFPTVLAFVVDIPRRAKLHMVVVLSKTYVAGCEFIKEWMDDYESYQEMLEDALVAGNIGYWMR